eukprot:COSAG02_NODE_785_length_17228_cov_24.082141_4_plen_107_part_00
MVIQAANMHSLHAHRLLTAQLDVYEHLEILDKRPGRCRLVLVQDKQSKSGRLQSVVFMAIERAASIVGLQSTVFTKGVLIVHREVVDGSLAQYFPSTTFSHHLYIF